MHRLRSPLTVIIGAGLALAVLVVAVRRPIEVLPPPSRPPVAPRPTSADAAVDRGFLGVVVSSSTVDISSPREGRLQSIAVRVGEQVERGQALASLDTSMMQGEVAVAAAQLKKGQADAQRATLERQQAEERFERARAAAAYLNVEELSAAKYQLGFTTANEASAKARVEEQSALLEQLRERLRQSILRAPTSGRVSERYLDPGAVVGAGSVVLRMVGSEGLRVRFAIPDDSTATVFEGGAISVTLGPAGGRVSGRVLQVAPNVDPASGTTLAEAVLDAVEPQPPYGTTVRVFAEGRP